MMKKILVAVVCLLFVLPWKGMAQPADIIYIFPEPVSYKKESGTFTIHSSTAIEIKDADSSLEKIAALLSTRLSVPTGYMFPVKKVQSFSEGNIHLQYNTAIGKKEGYQLLANNKEVVVSGSDAAGVFYGAQTLIQLLPKEIESKKKQENISWTIPAVIINDYPRFHWRGAMLDVARHFFTVDQVKTFIDNMVKYKFNRLHLHLTDDQGWRIEIKSLPQLTKVGAWRAERLGKWGNTPRPNPNEPKTYGGFFTHEDIRELVRYAKERFIEILPEVDVPGHSLAAVASYPELSCTTDSVYHVSVGDKVLQWHSKGFSALIDNTLCPANEKVYEFLDKVFTEVAELFPFEYIHMGGDECAKNFWAKSAQIKSLMKREGIEKVEDVQGYFVTRVEKIITSKGKKMIGWDEILEGKLSKNTAVMSWRGMKGGIKAAKAGHPVVMSPSTHAYYDLYQGDPIAEPPTYSMVRLRESYKFDPLPEGIDPSLILGGQGNLWTEQIQNMRHAQYMLYPRTLAVADAVWSPKEKKNWNNFITRVEHEFHRMDMADIKYSRSMYDPLFKSFTDKGNLVLEMETEMDNLDIHYSFDGSLPDKFYPKYSGKLIIPKDVADVKVITYRDGQPVGKIISVPVSELQKRAKKK